jgi:hypothetical protein
MKSQATLKLGCRKLRRPIRGPRRRNRATALSGAQDASKLATWKHRQLKMRKKRFISDPTTNRTNCPSDTPAACMLPVQDLMEPTRWGTRYYRHGIATCTCVDRLNAAVPVITILSARSVWERSDLLRSGGARSFPFILSLSQNEQTSPFVVPASSSVFHRRCLVGPILACQHVGATERRLLIAGFKNRINSRSLAITSKKGAIPCPHY